MTLRGIQVYRSERHPGGWCIKYGRVEWWSCTPAILRLEFESFVRAVVMEGKE
jgi:hypothetical protein